MSELLPRLDYASAPTEKLSLIAQCRWRMHVSLMTCYTIDLINEACDS
jgi:hypothetical protein